MCGLVLRLPPLPAGASHQVFGGREERWEVKPPSLASSMSAVGTVADPTLLQAGSSGH